jgi:pyridoxine kinase
MHCISLKSASQEDMSQEVAVGAVDDGLGHGEGRRILSVQSHVVSGYVGNKAAVFPLQLLGYDVDFINTVEFSNHTGYPQFTGTRMNGEQLEALVEMLQSNRLLHYNCVLTGYIGTWLIYSTSFFCYQSFYFVGSVSFISSVVSLIEKAQEVNPQLKYTCDPVLGDGGKLYVPESLIPVFIEKVIPIAHMITPNQFEAELLSGIKIESHETAVHALQAMHRLGPRIVVLTSAEFHTSVFDFAGYEQAANHRQYLNCYALEAIPAGDGQGTEKVVVTRIVIEKLLGRQFTGTGDAMAALLTAWTDQLGPGNAGEALEIVLATIQGVLAKTIEIQASRADVAADVGDSKLEKAINARYCHMFALIIVLDSYDLHSYVMQAF